MSRFGDDGCAVCCDCDDCINRGGGVRVEVQPVVRPDEPEPEVVFIPSWPVVDGGVASVVADQRSRDATKRARARVKLLDARKVKAAKLAARRDKAAAKKLRESLEQWEAKMGWPLAAEAEVT